CTDDPPSWDKESMNPAACDGCPVFELCAVYAATGAVRHGIIAGRHACEMTCHKEAAA
ncbi:transcriptional regulator, partial [Cutibacterium acnes]